MTKAERKTKRRTNILPEADACIECGNRRRDQLIILLNSGVPGAVECGRCGYVYAIAPDQLPTKRRAKRR